MMSLPCRNCIILCYTDSYDSNVAADRQCHICHTARRKCSCFRETRGRNSYQRRVDLYCCRRHYRCFSSSSPKLCNDCRRQCFVAVTIVCGCCLHSHNLRYHRMLTSSSSLSSLSSPPTSKITVITIVGMDVAIITHQHNYRQHVPTRCTDLYNKTSDQFSSWPLQQNVGPVLFLTFTTKLRTSSLLDLYNKTTDQFSS